MWDGVSKHFEGNRQTFILGTWKDAPEVKLIFAILFSLSAIIAMLL